MEIGLVQLSQSEKTTNVTHTLTDTQRDQLNNGTLYAPRYEEAFLPKGKKRARSLRSLGLASLKLKNVSCEIENFVEPHLWKLRGTLRSRVLRVRVLCDLIKDV